MDIKRLDLNLLRVLLTVGQEGSVSSAAERLGLSQPAVSNAIGRLRTLTGDPMFVRGQGGMQMTDYAREIFRSVEIALASVESAMRERTQFDPGVARNTFTILMSSMGQAVSLPLLLQHAQKHAPGVRFNVMPLSRSTHLRQLETTEADLICGYVSRPKECLRSFNLFNTAFVCLFREDHRLIDDEITPELYAELEHVTVKREGEVGPAAELLGSLGLENRVKLSVSQVTAVPPILAATDLVLTTTRGFAETYTRMGGLRWLPLPYTIAPVKIGIYWHEKKQSDIANKWLRNFLRDSILKGYEE